MAADLRLVNNYLAEAFFSDKIGLTAGFYFCLFCGQILAESAL